MPDTFTMRPEITFDLTTYWVVVDGDNVGTIAPFKGGQLAPVSVPPDDWSWRIKFPLLDMPDWCKGCAPTLEQTQVEAEQAFTRIRGSMSQNQYDQAMWKRRQRQGP
jgi:hypothetical protein